MFTKTRLPEYFFGDDVNRDDKLAKNDNILLGTNLIVEDFHVSEPNLSRISSPASSIASTKKLEWDSGADIGYNVYNSFKKSRRSKSFPILNMDLSISQINKSDETQGDAISIENKLTGGKEISFVNLQCSSQFEYQENKEKNSFKHSTPNEEKMISKAYKNSKKDKSGSTNKNEAEYVQTTQVIICSRSVQTDDNLINDNQKVNKSQQTDTIKSLSSSSGSSLSKSSSFQYIPGSNKSKASTETSDTGRTDSHTTESVQSKKESTNTAASKKSSGTSSQSTVSNSSNISPLGQMISTQQSKNLISDIDKSLHILQKFISSKYYTSDTKKYYARKVVSKIISSKYTEDSSTNSSISTLSTGKCSEKPIQPSIKTKSNDSNDITNLISKENTKSEKVSCGVQCDPTQKNESTETSQKKIFAEKLKEIISKNNQFTEESKHKNKSDVHSDVLNKNWRDAETLSEKLFEARKKSLQSSSTSINTTGGMKNIGKSKKDDYLVQHSKNERKRQLSWINNEISYLHRLKELLQKNDTSSNGSVDTESKTKSRQQSISSDKTINSSVSDVETKFYQEFGDFTNSLKVTDNIKNLRKVSKYLSNDQIKFLIDNDAKKSYCQTCDCCKRRHSDTLKSDENQSIETKNKNSVKDCASLDIHNNSFNSHNYKFYENLVKSRSDSKQSSLRENSHFHKQKVSDTGVQCTLEKKEHHPQISTDGTNYSSEYSKDSLNDSKKVKIFYKDPNFRYSESKSTVSGKIDSEIVPEYKRAQKTGKENNYHPRRQVRQKQIKPSSQKPIAYILTFEEESMADFVGKNLQKQKPLQKPLENVTIKIPKLAIKNSSTSEENDKNLTLKDYLMKNRPDFVRTADWRRNIVSDRSKKMSKNVFTCLQMKELTLKKYNRLAEVRSRIHLCKVSDQKRHNRYKAKEFGEKLQRQTLKGHLSIATCRNILSSD